MLLAGCAAEDGPDASDLPPLVVDPGSVHVVGTSDTISRIADLMPVGDGSVWVLNNTEPFLVHLDAEGRVVRTQGARGGGPGEFSWPSTLVRDPGTGAVWVYEAALGRLIRIEADVDEPEVRALPQDSAGPVRINSYEYLWMNNGGRVWMRATDQGFVFAQASPAVPWIYGLWSTEVVRLRRDGRLETVASTADLVGDPEEHFPGATRFLPYPLWASCPDGSLALYDPGRNGVHRLRASGDTVAWHVLPDERRLEVTSERVFETVHPGVLRNRLFAEPPGPDVMREMVERDYDQRIDEFSDVFPEYAELECAEGGTLWIQPFDATHGQMGRGPLWLRISEDGAMGQVRFPGDFRPMRFLDRRIWGIHRGAYDVDHVAWVEMPAG